MPEAKPSTPAGPSTVPTITIPGDFEQDDYGDIAFPIHSDAGEVEVRSWFAKSFVCEGTPQALAAAGIICLDWILADRRGWCVAFNDEGAFIHMGKKGRPKGPYLRFISRDNGSYCSVTVPVSTEQREWLTTQRARARERGDQHHAALMEFASGAVWRSVPERKAAPPCERRGNVICWPGRGRVSAVTLQ